MTKKQAWRMVGWAGLWVVGVAVVTAMWTWLWKGRMPTIDNIGIVFFLIWLGLISAEGRLKGVVSGLLLAMGAGTMQALGIYDTAGLLVVAGIATAVFALSGLVGWLENEKAILALQNVGIASAVAGIAIVLANLLGLSIVGASPRLGVTMLLLLTTGTATAREASKIRIKGGTKMPLPP